MDPSVPLTPDPAEPPQRPGDDVGANGAEERSGAFIEDPTGADPDATSSRRRRRTRSYVIGSIAGVLIAALVAAAFVQLPYYRFAPGTLYPTQPLISVEGAPRYQDDGSIEFTTVASKKVSLLELGLAKLDPAVEIVDAEKVEGTSSAEEIRQINLEMMADAKLIAQVVALRELGYDVPVHGTGAVVRAVGEGLPAAGVLSVNDTIVSIDGTPVTTATEAVDALGRHAPGDTVTLRVEPVSPEGVTGESREEVVTLAEREDEPGKPMLGVSLGTRDTEFDLPFTIDIDSRDVGGPSAGLALALGIIDVMTPGSLTGGGRVAVTGTVDLDGNVGVIGGIQQKTYLAARDGVKVFIVPADEAEDARRWAPPDLEIIGVRTVGEALDALAAYGGDVDVIEQAAPATTATPGTTGP